MAASSSWDNLLLAATLLQVTPFISRLVFIVLAGVSASVLNSAITCCAANSTSTLLVFAIRTGTVLPSACATTYAM